MQDAQAFRCPNCGGPTDAAARRCEYCRSALATLRCAACFHLNAGNARHCTGCGLELGLEPIATHSQLRCPACTGAMEALTEPAGTLFACAGCNAQFVEHRLLAALIEREDRARAELTSGPLRAQNPCLERIAYRSCPLCGTLMLRKNFGARSGVIVDVCSRHGSFLDSGELPEILRFVARGGLSRERREAAERARSQSVAIRALPTAGDAANPLEFTLEDVFHFFERLLKRGSRQ